MDPEKTRELMGKLTDDQRKELAEKLDRDMDDYMSNLESKSSKYMDGWNEETWEKEMESHPFFTQNVSPDQELSPLLQGIQDLKYSPDENTPEELAKNYKEDGNFNFKYKKYRFAVASYTEGLKSNCKDELLNVQLMTNRAAAQMRIGNYRSALIDCRLAIKRLPGHVKALEKAAQCCMQLKRYQECISFCDKGLEIDPKDKTFLEFRTKAQKLWKEVERNERKKAMEEKKREWNEMKILDAIKAKGIAIERNSKSDLTLDDLEPKHPAAYSKPVHFLDEKTTNLLVWPVLFLYPEHGQTDFVEAFVEDQRFEDHLQVMFGKELPPWDEEGKYNPENLRLYFEYKKETKLVEFRSDMTLNEVLSDKRYCVTGGTPGIIVLVNKSKFQVEFLKKYE